MSTQEMPIFTRTFDLLTWLLPVTNHFPRAHRHTVTKRLLDAAFDLRESLEEANVRRGPDRLDRLQAADEALAKLRLYLRLISRWTWLSPGQYEHVSVMVTEIGRLLGGWKKTVPQGHAYPWQDRRYKGADSQAPGAARRLLQQHRPQHTVCRAEQEQPEQQERQHRISGGGVHIFCERDTCLAGIARRNLGSSGPRQKMAESVPGRA